MSNASGRRDRKTSLNRYLADIRDRPRLDADQEQRVGRRIRAGDDAAVAELVESGLPFVVDVAKKYRNLGVPFEDLLNEGNLGLIEAAQRYDETKGNKFITYAVWWIRKSILKALNDQSSVVRVPINRQNTFRRIRVAAHTLERTIGRKPTREEVAGFLERSQEQVDIALHSVHPQVSIDDVNTRTGKPLSWQLINPDAASTESSAIVDECRVRISEALKTLTPRERSVIEDRFGFHGKESRTLKAIGKSLGMTREAVRQIELRAKLKMRRFLEGKPITSPPQSAAVQSDDEETVSLAAEPLVVAESEGSTEPPAVSFPDQGEERTAQDAVEHTESDPPPERTSEDTLNIGDFY